MARALGIGGVFFKAREPHDLARWYETWLGLEIDPSFGGTSFQASQLPAGAYGVWSPFKATTTYFDPSTNPFMINLIVDDLSEALAQVEKGGATLVGTPEELEYGAFGWFMDPEGNKVELWQPGGRGSKPHGEVSQPGEDNKQLVRRYYEEVINTGEVDEIARFIAPDYVEVFENKRYPTGLDGARDHVRGVRQTYPDLHLTIQQQIAEGEWVVTHAWMRGTQQQQWQGIEPTGKPIEVTTVNIDRVVDGRIVEHGGTADLLSPLLATGAIRPTGPRDD